MRDVGTNLVEHAIQVAHHGGGGIRAMRVKLPRHITPAGTITQWAQSVTAPFAQCDHRCLMAAAIRAVPCR